MTPAWCPRCWDDVGDGEPACPTCEQPAPAAGWPRAESEFAADRRFVLLDRITCGESAAVFHARDAATGGRRILKVLRDLPARPADAQARIARQFRDECRAMFALNGTPRFPEAPRVDAERYIVMEEIDAPTLAKGYDMGARDHDDAVSLVKEVLAGLRELHREGIVHRDLKPSNLFVEERDDVARVWIADLGVCLYRGRGAAESTAGTSALIGTPDYMSPEQMDDPWRVDARSDLYAVASILWQMVEGAVPYPLLPGPTLEARLAARREALRRPPAPPSKLPRPLQEVLVRALAESPERRFADCDAFLAALDDFRVAWKAHIDTTQKEAKERLAACLARTERLVGELTGAHKLHRETASILDALRRHDGRIALSAGATADAVVVDLNKMEAQLARMEREAAAMLARADAPEAEPPAAPPRPSAFTRASQAVALAWAAALVGWFARPILKREATAAPVASTPYAVEPAAPGTVSERWTASVTRSNPWLALSDGGRRVALQQHEVSRGEYQLMGRAAGASTPRLDDGQRQLPATGLTQAEAARYCAALGGRLPDAEDWRRAAGDHRIWSDPAGFVVGAAPPVTQPPRADYSPGGYFALLGGVREWVGADTHGGPAVVATIGASSRVAGADLVDVASELVTVSATEQRHDDIGFRCAKDL